MSDLHEPGSTPHSAGRDEPVSLDKVCKDPCVLARLPVSVILRLRCQAGHLTADLDAALFTALAQTAAADRARNPDRLLGGVAVPAGLSGHRSQLAGADQASSSLLTVADAETVLRFSRGHIYELIRTGKLRAIRSGRAIRIPPDALADWAARHDTVDDTNSVSLPSPHDRRTGQAHPAGAGADPAAVRQPSRRPQSNRGQVGDGRPGHAGSSRPADRAARPKRQRWSGSPSKAPSGEAAQAEGTADG